MALPTTAADPRAMTTRARVYLGAAGFRHFSIGLSLLLTPQLYLAAAFIPIFNLLPLPVWGVVMTLEGVACALAAATRHTGTARGSIGFSAVITSVMAAGLSVGIIASWLNGLSPSPVLGVILLALTVKDFTMCAQPLRVPLEESVGVLHPKAV